MGKAASPQDFQIHVDGSCLTDSTDLHMEVPSQRTLSDQTVIRHSSPAHEKSEEQAGFADDLENSGVAGDDSHDDKHDHRERLDPRIEAQIQAAARKVVAKIESDRYDGNEDSILSGQTEESYNRHGTELTFNGTENTYDSDADHHRDHELDSAIRSLEEEQQSHHEQGRDLQPDELEANILSHNGDDSTQESLERHSETDEKAPANRERSRLSQYELETSAFHNEKLQGTIYDTKNENLDDEHGDSSSHHDGDIDDDVFSRNSGHSQRSSLNSIQDINSSDETYNQKALTSPLVGEEAASSHPPDCEPVSRIPSGISYNSRDEAVHRTPSKVLDRPPFRTPSSVRAIQMSSPPASIFSTPRSTKRHLAVVSRISTPTSQYSPSKRTPTRFKAKREQPLVLLHVTVLPLQWQYSHLMASVALPERLDNVRDSWQLLHEKLGDTVLERGVLLPHPQDDYEILEERLLEALELPVLPRARILKCGHYIGGESPSSDSENDMTDNYRRRESGAIDRKWCDICARDVRLEGSAEFAGDRKFRVKIYASNGMMTAGAWAAAWREMERVDVEIEPWIEVGLHKELEKLALLNPLGVVTNDKNIDDGFVDELEGEDVDPATMDPNLREEDRSTGATNEEQVEGQGREVEEDIAMKLMEEEDLTRKIAEEEELQRRFADVDMTDKHLEEERMREIYRQEFNEEPPSERHQPSRRAPPRQSHSSTTHPIDPNSLSDLLFAAFKVALSDKRNIAIGLLSVLVLLLALRPGSFVSDQSDFKIGENISELETMTHAMVTASGSLTSDLEAFRALPTEASDVAETKGVVPCVDISNIQEISRSMDMPAATILVDDALIGIKQSELDADSQVALEASQNDHVEGPLTKTIEIQSQEPERPFSLLP